ncbi:sugar phosphate isomerase/epimerase family protein [Spirillospora sp. NPDC048911]|uniref:sugar phosphate isomerase/epimerase family protein n=1 Tax=Spirillospora sp. NPDC048911 TaxID=3364527 RepID=UPI00371C4DD6
MEHSPLLAGTTWSCPGQTLLEALETLEQAGLFDVEVWADGMHLDPRVDPEPDRVARWLASRPLQVRSVHLPFDAVLPGGTADQRTEEWVRLCARTLDFAQRLGATVAVAHPVLFSDEDDGHARTIDRFVPAVQAIADDATSRGMRLAVENMHTMRGATLRTVREIRGALANVTGPVGICLDLGHAVFNGCDLRDEITAATGLLINAHVHDSDGTGRDPHLPPGDGIVDWPAAMHAFQAINYSGRYVLEVRGGDDPLGTLRRSRERLLSFMS